MRTFDLGQYEGDDLTRLRNAISDLKGNPGSSLIIPPGHYFLHEDTAFAYQQAVMAGEYGDNPYLTMFHPKSTHVIGLDFSGLENASIYADGATFYIDGFMETLAIQHCKGVEIHGLTLDMKRRPYSKGVICEVGDRWFDVDFAPEEMISEKMPMPRMLVVDEKERKIVTALTAALHSNAVKERINGNTYRIYYSLDRAMLGKTFYALHTWHSRPAILIFEAEDIKLTDVKIHCNPGMGIVGHRAKNITLNRVMVVPPVGEYASTNTDATHFVSCKGLLSLHNCFFEGHGDDAINVHGYYQTIQAVNGQSVNLKVMVTCATHSLRLDHPDEGDLLELVSRKNLQPLGTFRVVSVLPDEEAQSCQVILDKALPDGMVGNVMVNLTQQPALHFIGCHVRNHLARSMLIRTSNVRVEGCSFERSFLNAITISAEMFWNESTVSSDVVIRGNRIVNCGGNGVDFISGQSVGGIDVYLGAEDAQLQLFRKITVENNLIDCPKTKYAMRFSGVNGLCLRGNETNGQIMVDNCRICDVPDEA